MDDEISAEDLAVVRHAFDDAYRGRTDRDTSERGFFAYLRLLGFRTPPAVGRAESVDSGRDPQGAADP